MITGREWGRAYFEQAYSDWLAYKALSDTSLPHCHQLHSLQMAIEKLGKALRLAAGGLRVEDRKKTHLAFVKYIGAAKYDRGLRDFLSMRSGQFQEYCDSMRQAADAIERLQPQLAGERENVEYPWEGPTAVLAPALTNFHQFGALRSPAGVKLLDFVFNCFRYHRTVTFSEQEGAS